MLHAAIRCLMLAAAAIGVVACAPPSDTPRLPAASDTRMQGAALATACEGRDGWSDPAPPARIHGNTYFVGTCGISVLLITTPRGHVLIDGATAEAAPHILANIRTLGFDPREVRLIVGSHEHHDHMGGFAALQAGTGAAIWVSPGARAAVESGMVDRDDPQFGLIEGMTPVTVAGTLADYHRPAFPSRDWPLTAVFTPGHTTGGTSWIWQSCEGEACVNFAYIDSLSAVSRDGYRFADHPERVAPYRTTFDRVRAMPCEVLITPHHSASNLFERLAGRAPLANRAACRELADMMEARLDARLAQETAN